MGYRLGVDLGTTYTAAAVVRPGAAPEVVPLGSRGNAVPSVLFLGADGTLLVGEAAERRAVTDPDRVVRQFKRRLGDSTPLVIGSGARSSEHLAHDLAATFVWWVLARVTEREGGAPEAIAVTHPATWGPHKKELLLTALAAQGVPNVTLVTEPEAVAVSYAHTGRVAPGATLAVYDFGGGTFDAALLRATDDGRFTTLGRPHGLPSLGGIDFDDAILAHVLGSVGNAATDLDMADPLVVTAMARLRRECVDAKEALSADTSATIPVLLTDARTNIRITRAEFDDMIRTAVLATLDVLDATLDSADLDPEDLTNVLLAGGSSRIPLVAQMLSHHLGAPVSIDRDIDPKLAVAIGAALALPGGGSRVATVVPGAAASAAMLPPVAAAARNRPAPEPVAKPAPVPMAVVKPVPAPPVVSPKPKATPKPRTVATSISLPIVVPTPVLTPEPAPATQPAVAAEPTVAALAATKPALTPRPTRPASSTAYLTTAAPEKLPPAKSKLRPSRALTLLGITTVLMLGSGVGLSAVLGDGAATSTTQSTEVTSPAAAPAKDVSKVAPKDKKKAEKTAEAVKVSAPVESDSSASDTASGPATTTTSPAATTTAGERAAAKRKAAAKKPTKSTDRKAPRSSTGSDPSTVGSGDDSDYVDEYEYEIPTVPADEENVPEDPASVPAEPDDSDTVEVEQPAPVEEAPVEPAQPTDAGADEVESNGFSPTAPPEAP